MTDPCDGLICELLFRVLEQTKKGGGDNVTVEAEQAEALLLVNKPFTEFVSPLTQLVRHCLTLTPSHFAFPHLSPSIMYIFYNTE